MHIPGHPGYSFAEHMSDRGFLVIAVDPLGVGSSSRPADVDAVNLQTMATAAAEFVRRLRGLLAAGGLDRGLAPLEDVPLVAVGHSLGGCLAIVQQAVPCLSLSATATSRNGRTTSSPSTATART
jgi:pimeloyl-ACP methyl ester carboxylesterase